MEFSKEDNESVEWCEKTKKHKENAEYLAMHFKVSTREAYDYLNILDKKTIKSIIKNYKNEPSRKTIQSS